MILIKQDDLKLFHNGAGKTLIQKLCATVCDNMLIKTSTTTDSNNDWCEYPTTIEEDLIERKEDYIKLLSGMILAFDMTQCSKVLCS